MNADYLAVSALSAGVGANILIMRDLITRRILRGETKDLEQVVIGLEDQLADTNSGREMVLGERGAIYDYYFLHARQVEIKFAQFKRAIDALACGEAEKTERKGWPMRRGMSRANRVHSQSELEGNVTHPTELDLYAKFRLVQDLMHARGQLTLRKLVDGYDRVPLAPLYDLVRNLELEIGGKYDRVVREFEDIVSQEQARRTPLSLPKLLPGNYAIRTCYRISNGPCIGTVALKGPWEPPFEITVIAPCDEGYVGEGGSEKMVPGREITVTCVGYIEDCNPEGKELTLSPTAIFRFLFP